MLTQVISRVAQLDTVALGFQIQIDGRPGFSDLMGKGRLANLARANDGNSRKTAQQFGDLLIFLSVNYPCNIGYSFLVCRTIFEHCIPK